MSRTVAEAVRTTRYYLRDRNPQSEAFSEPEYVMAIQSAVRVLSGDVLLGEAWIDPFITLIPGQSVYGTPSGTSVDAIRILRSNEDGRDIPIVSQATFEEHREGDPGTITGMPLVATMREGSTQGLELMLWPIPDESGTLSAFRSALPAPFFTAGTGRLAALPASTNIPFDDAAFEATCLTVALDLWNRMPDERKQRNMLGPDTAAGWPQRIGMLIKQSRMRRRMQQSGTYVRRARRW
jgi:hypothetical protein